MRRWQEVMLITMLFRTSSTLKPRLVTRCSDAQVPKEEVMEVSLWDADPLGDHHTHP